MKVRIPGAPPDPIWLENIRAHYWIHDILQIFVGLGCWIIQRDQQKKLDWMELTPQDPMTLKPHHFEIAYGKESLRDAFHVKNFDRAAKERHPIVDQCWGASSLFIYIGEARDRQVFLYSDYFLTRPIDWATLTSQWKALTGKNTSETDPDFTDYVRMNLKYPVLQGPLLQGVIDFFECYVKLLLGQDDSALLYERVNQLRINVFSRYSHNKAWIDQALGREKLIPPPWAWEHGYHLEPWMVEELGVTEIPNYVFAVMPSFPLNESRFSAQSAVQNHLIQKQCLAFAKTLSQTMAENLEDYGTAFLTHASGKDRGRSQVMEKAQAVRRFISEKFGLESMIGVGRQAEPGQTLHSSYQEAIMALNLCVQTDKNIYFYADNIHGKSKPSYQKIQQAESELFDAVADHLTARIKLMEDHYVRAILEFAANHTGVVRGQFLSCLSHLSDHIGQKKILNSSQLSLFWKKLERRLSTATTISELIYTFKDAIHNLSILTGNPTDGTKTIRLQELLVFVEKNYNRSLPLQGVARQTGFSIPVFCRLFKKTTGLSFVTYLNKLRVEKSKTILKTSTLPIYQIGENCGFPNTYLFNRNFRRWVKMTPTDYRKKFASISA